MHNNRSSPRRSNSARSNSGESLVDEVSRLEHLPKRRLPPPAVPKPRHYIIHLLLARDRRHRSVLLVASQKRTKTCRSLALGPCADVLTPRIPRPVGEILGPGYAHENGIRVGARGGVPLV